MLLVCPACAGLFGVELCVVVSWLAIPDGRLYEINPFLNYYCNILLTLETWVIKQNDCSI